MKRFAVVSGGADGIGKEVVLEFLDAGFAVAAFDINDEKLAKVSEELKDRDCLLYTSRYAHHWSPSHRSHC